ncbi:MULTISPECIES: TetR/AcrR family transcriptional regulator [unclassified Shewanella]|uniref:TetR/AcrR family transcriptional regulator n=1 Tax=unclassified Shewanella TaxID=196818 RepID=UPI000C867A8A|nr:MULTISPECIES: TetR/AcrR family transcriptional regulator [unclassified Shewanella]MDO6620063.1 TetR/AcrR family transcriptional regulator [Shewanella sp. 6_MG-2023]MDO6679321.1 TetR/AcrR family transcriptional regulator [Shewanella sp. 4_MG-2023]PMG50807.1 TetR family transcriptional regulator [Shewanella sp. 10N.286.52.B9]PMH84760.1 TetR family transcriptional regulator [Shewanella sp. 10N.286.48.B5]PMI01866.1 TetR family transcriptional regulator [Shewanella sp. 10N.286.48.A6]
MTKAAKFNREETIQKAANLYWQKGFHATSMRNLQEVIDLRPGSIYASFGSKEGLFKEALQYYAQTGVEMLAQCRIDAGSPLRALKLFIERSVLANKSTVPSGMCMLVKTVAELTTDNADLLAEAKSALGMVEAEFAALLTEAQQLGELDTTQDPQALARFIQVQIIGIRTYAHANQDDDTIQTLIDGVFESSQLMPGH